MMPAVNYRRSRSPEAPKGGNLRGDNVANIVGSSSMISFLVVLSGSGRTLFASAPPKILALHDFVTLLVEDIEKLNKLVGRFIAAVRKIGLQNGALPFGMSVLFQVFPSI